MVRKLQSNVAKIQNIAAEGPVDVTLDMWDDVLMMEDLDLDMATAYIEEDELINDATQE
jgi:hypothetical protein